MPCFKGLAVSIHASSGPLPEYSIQKNHRVSRIASFIPVPSPQLSENGGTIPSTFAVSITLLVPNQAVPYSAPPRTSENPWPEPKYVSSLPNMGDERGKYTSSVGPYVPLTHTENETIAAYIHFDGRAKEEVATLLRRGEETWVNSRWVSVPASEGGGLAEREFLFREVGLERWLNGLDLQGGGKDVAARIAKRKQKLEKRRRKKLSEQDSSDENTAKGLAERSQRRRAQREKSNVLRYGADKAAPMEALEDSDSGSQSDSDDEVPEAAGQIKVSLFRVLASGEVKRGEYSPQFDAHDDDEMDRGEGEGENAADVDHTTTFAKPKTLDPKSISTQTVTGIDPPDRPFASFTFFYRGKKQLQKMGILQNTDASSNTNTQSKAKTKQFDAASLGKLKAKEGTVGFTGYRDSAKGPAKAFGEKAAKSSTPDEMDSDADDEDDSPQRKANGAVKADADEDAKDVVLSAEEIARRAELADGVKKMQLKRQHSFDTPTSSSAVPDTKASSNDPTSQLSSSTDQPSAPSLEPGPSPTSQVLGDSTSAALSNKLGSPHMQQLKDASSPGNTESPYKRQRASIEDPRPVSSFAGRLGSSAFANFNPNSTSGIDAAESSTDASKLGSNDSGGQSSAAANTTRDVQGQKEDSMEGR